ncbi:MAG: transcription-repair coupling factor, partial [Xanthomonadales bacterium]|nr:transcription-repair coupling factor [Xanthomonadales bacterium]
MTVTKPPMLTVPLPKTGQQRAWWRQPDSRSAWALALRSAAQQHDGLLLAITHDTHTAQVLEQDLHAFGGDLPVMHFPDWETLPYDLFSPHPDIVSQRIAALYRLPSLRRGIFVLPVQTLMQRLPPTGYIAGGTLMLKLGQRLNLEDEKRRLETAGYRNVPQVLDPGDFAVRGSLLDIYAMGASEPYRIELLDDEIDAIRPFDPETQRSSGKLDAIELLPGREFPMDEAASKRVREILRERFPIDPRRCPVYQDLKGGGAPAGIEYYLPLFFDDTATLFDYLPKNALLALDAGVLESAEAFWMQTGERYEQRRHDIERPILPPAEILLPSEHLRHQFNATPLIETVAKAHARFSDADDLGVQHAPELPLNVRDAEPAAALKSFLASYPGRVLIAADSAGRREALLEALGAGGIKPGVVANWEEFCSPLPAGEGLGVRVPVSGELDAIPGPHPNLTSAVADARSPGGRGALPAFATVAAFDNGFAISEPPICVLTERQLYPDRAGQPRRRRRSDRDPDSIIRDLSEIAEGSPIVHEDHGVGRYRGLVTLNVGDTPAEFLEIEYAKGDKLYVPVAQLHLVSRYSGASPDAAPLHSLGGEQWEKAKKRAAQKVRDVAAELLEIQARREARKGRALQTDRTMYEQFAAGFPFEETPDQQQAIEAVIDDLARERPMDRVVCGDVG